MFKKNKILILLFLTIAVSIAVPNISYGNSSEPPSILIIVPNAPDDLEITIETGDDFAEPKKINKLFETYYAFYSIQIGRDFDYIIHIKTGDIKEKIALGEKIQSYRNIYTLDMDTRTLVPGKTLSRSITLVSLRIFLTLIVEGLLFWIFGFRDKKSWINFFIINLITQGGLNIWLNDFFPIMGYIVFALIFAEVFIFIFEIIAFLIFIKEKSKIRTISYVIIANAISLVAGGYIITLLPI